MKFVLLVTVLIVGITEVTCGEFEDFKRDIIAAHNTNRAKHGVRGLKWDDEVAKVAQAWTDDLAKRNVFQHNPHRNGYGENLFRAWGYPVSAVGKGAANGWYNEVNNYDFSKPGFSYNTGHFTQLVWKSTKKLGCGYSTRDVTNKRGRKMLAVWVCCNYYPGGNINQGSYFQENVLPPRE